MYKIKKVDKKVAIGAGAIMLAAFLWSLDGIFIRPKFYVLPASLVVFLEHALGFLVLSPFIIISWPKIKLLRPKDWGAIFWVCVFGGLIGTIMITKAFFAAMDGEVTFATVVILQKLQPVFALIMARLILGERLSKKFYLWAGVAVAAAYFLAFGKTGLMIGEINLFHSAAFFAILAAFAFGSSTVLGKRIVNHLDFKSTAALRFGLTGLMAFILILATGDLFKTGDLQAVHWRLLVLIVFTSGAGAIFIYYFGLKRVTASQATICELFWPLSAVVLDYILNKNVLNSIQIISTLVLLMAFFQVIKEGRAEEVVFTAGVVNGRGRGKRIGFPTINLDKVDLDINYGIYLVEAALGGKVYRGLIHFGFKETYSESASLELLLKDLIPDVGREKIKIKIIKKLRDIKRFKNTEELKKQIEEDLEELK
ncbi:EamA family transporter [Candidatus Falkowbacteria bacterium CG11_big_fil_rev_8_21_14_0_20_39_10]|uniref:riboflavin kinase n=1 Tax=Candidatus Falkowbacteria bacterium CG11_big_fil_rev_8_21_14_0_20_39_10 TaxID=1974570 RepID=A0A2M6K9X6_9BACT|nr:MAG: EamA family transporter [Candidatus Falkowbacteria bacterium CG11_big_fil_rev_8_21_14_0_20_39_10]